MKHVSSQLIGKRAELQGQLNKLNQEVKTIKEVIKNIDASIRVFEAGFDVSTIKTKKFYKKNHIFKHGEINKLTLEVLRESTEGLCAKDIVEKVMCKKNLNPSNANIYNGIETNIRKNLDKNQFIESIKETGHPKRWKIADPLTLQITSQ